MASRRCVLILTAALLPLSLAAQGGGNIHPTAPPVVRAGPASGQISIDGRLDEADWATVQPAGDFLQNQPHEGQPATERTEVRFLFDRDALYVGARMFDDKGAAGITARLSRRDQFTDDDAVQVIFDTFHDHLGQAQFTINARGVKNDALGQGGSGTDDSWDPVYEVATTIDSLGWSAELRIPFNQLRYPRDSMQTWGVQILRQVARLNELSQWAFWRLNEAGGPSRFGHLEGLVITATPGKAEVLPYVVGRSTNVPVDPNNPFADPHTLDSRVGLDMKYLLTSNLTLSATVNPDFGQVEVDPAVVNLSAFETFFEERRPFFIEGAGLFSFGSLNCFFCSNVSSISMFYSRRIGRQPQVAGAVPANSYADVPRNTEILGAAKISGRTAGGWSLGIMDAVTRRERAEVELTDSAKTRLSVPVEPFTNYFVSRFAKDLGGGSKVIRGIFTSVHRDLTDSIERATLTSHAEGAGLETNLWFGKRTYRLMATAAVSQISGDSAAILHAQHSSARYFQRPDRQNGHNGLFSDAYDSSLTRMRGYALYARVSKDAGDWEWEAATNLRSPGFEVNDLAFLSRADFIWMSGNLLRQWTKPTRYYRQLLFIAGGQQQYNYDGDLTDRQTQLFAYTQTLGFWDISGFWIHRFFQLDDRLLRGGPVGPRPGANFFEVSANSNTRKKAWFSTNPSRGCNQEGACDWSADLGLTVRARSNVSISIGPGYNHSETRQQYVTDVAEPGAAAFFGRTYVFANLAQNVLSMNTRLNITFTPTLSLEVFAQPFIASGRFSRFKQFVAPRRLAKQIFGVDVGSDSVYVDSTSGVEFHKIDPDGLGGLDTAFTIANPSFTTRSLRGNAVLRWEYRPGSTLYLVWTQSRQNDLVAGDIRMSRDVSGLFKGAGENIFLVKVNYWLGF